MTNQTSAPSPWFVALGGLLGVLAYFAWSWMARQVLRLASDWADPLPTAAGIAVGLLVFGLLVSPWVPVVRRASLPWWSVVLFIVPLVPIAFSGVIGMRFVANLGRRRTHALLT